MNFSIQGDIHSDCAFVLIKRRAANGQGRGVGCVFKNCDIATYKRDLSVGNIQEARVGVRKVQSNRFVCLHDFITRRCDFKRSCFAITFTRIERNVLNVESEVACRSSTISKEVLNIGSDRHARIHSGDCWSQNCGATIAIAGIQNNVKRLRSTFFGYVRWNDSNRCRVVVTNDVVGVRVETGRISGGYKRIRINRFRDHKDISNTLDFNHDVLFALDKIVINNVQDWVEPISVWQKFSTGVVLSQVKRLATREIARWNQELKYVVVVTIAEEVVEPANRCTTNGLQRYEPLVVWNIR